MLVLMSFVISFAEPTSVLACTGITDGPILANEADWEKVNYEGNEVIDNFPIVQDGVTLGRVWILSNDHILVFDHQPTIEDVRNGYHPCGVYALSPVDQAILKETYAPIVGNSWQEFWLSTHEPKY